MDLDGVENTIKHLTTKGNYLYNKYNNFENVSVVDIYNNKTIAEQIENNKVRISTIKEPSEVIKHVHKQ